jgi:hypothetical protein
MLRCGGCTVDRCASCIYQRFSSGHRVNCRCQRIDECLAAQPGFTDPLDRGQAIE